MVPLNLALALCCLPARLISGASCHSLTMHQPSQLSQPHYDPWMQCHSRMPNADSTWLAAGAVLAHTLRSTLYSAGVAW